jgi:hypothetical protein
MQTQIEKKSSARPDSRLQIFVLIDALGWKYLEGREFLNDLLPYRSPLRTVLGFSSGAIPTILTGVPPSLNGHWNLYYYDPQKSPFQWLRYFRFLPDALLDNRVSRKIVKELGRRVLGMGPCFECLVSPRYMHLFNWVERKNIYERGGINGARSIFDQLAGRNIPYCVYSYHHWNDTEILSRAKADMESGPARFFFVYLSEMDHFLHDHCNDADLLNERFAWYESQLRELFACARRIDPEAGFSIFSDHGMAPVQRHCDVQKEVEDSGLRMPDDYLAVYDSTMVRFWFFSDRARQRMTEVLNGLDCGKILSDKELEQLGVFFADRRYGEVVFLLHPGWMLSRSDFNGPQWMPVGMHGYHPDDPYSDAVYLSNRQPPVDMYSIADVYRCMLEALA